MSSRKSTLGGDLLMFIDIANVLKIQHLSLRSLASEIDKSPSTLYDMIDRLNKRCENPLISSDESKLLQLTAFGETIYLDLIRRIESGINNINKISEITIAASNGLITMGVLTPILRDIISRLSHEIKVNLNLKSRLNVDLLQIEIKNEEIDLAIIWGSDERLDRIKNPVCVKEKLNIEFNIVLISHDKNITEEASDNLVNYRKSDVTLPGFNFLSNKTVVTLDNQAQMFREWFPIPDPLAGGRLIIVETFDAAIASVRSKLADAAIIPYVNSELNRYRQTGQLFVSDPIGTINLHAIYSASKKKNVITILDEFKHHFDEIKVSKEIQNEFKISSVMPADQEWYTRIRFGYYICADTNTRGEAEWCWESIKINSISNNDKNLLRFTGEITNQFDNKFEITDAIASKEVFMVHTNKIEETVKISHKNETCEEFTSVFTWCDKAKGVICGTWSGKDQDKKPGLFGTIWSHSKLELKDLEFLSCLSSNRTVILSAESGLNLYNQKDIYNKA